MTSKPDKSHRAKRFASEEAADSLLADILDETADDALREEAELERSLASQRAAEADAAAQARAALLAERTRKLEAELERQRLLADKRTRKMDALRVVETPEPQTVEASEASAPDDELRRQIEAEVRREMDARPPEVSAAPVLPLPTSENRRASFAAAAAVILFAAGTAVVVFTSASYSPDGNSYAKSVFAPADREIVAMEVGFTLIPEAAAAPVEATAAPVRKPVATKRPAKTPRPKNNSSRPKQNAASKSQGKFKGIEAIDPFALD